MISGLGRFLGELRSAGITVSPAEWIEALRAVEIVGIENRERFRAALRVTLVKRAVHRRAFDEAFERFFTAPTGAGRDARPDTRQKRGARPGSAGQGNRPRGRPPISPPEADRPPRGSGHPVTPLAQAIEALRAGATVRHGRLRRVVVGRRPDLRDPSAGRDVARTPFREIARRGAPDDADAALARALRRQIESLRLGTARRVRRAPRGRPYLRRLFRESLRTDGVPFGLPKHKRREDTSRVILLVDVSWSTARAAGLFLALGGEFLRFGRQARVLLFVDRPVDGTDLVSRWVASRSRMPFAALLARVGGLNLAAPSDYGSVFHRLLRSPARPRGRRTVLVVLGDGRTNRFDPLPWAFAELADGLGAVVWLVPEALELWGEGDSALERYLPHVDTAVEARDLAGLARGVRELVRRSG